MALQSRLFGGDPAFEKCLVDDRAHVVEGARGPQVAKIHRALLTLDRAKIDAAETTDDRYGKSTAAAVLAYKTRRGIINSKYQTQADAIVGKMTIAALDREMLVLDRAPPPRGCREAMGSSGRAGSRARAATTSRDGDAPATSGPSVALRVVFQHAQLPPRGILQGLTLITEMVLSRFLAKHRMSFNVVQRNDFNFKFGIESRSVTDVVALRNAAGNALSDGQVGNAIRVIFCPFQPNEGFFASSYGPTGLTAVPDVKNFVVVNAPKRNPDGMTILHEMIHCSDNRFMNNDHDEDPNSILASPSPGIMRTVLRQVHADSLRRTFFAVPA